MQKWCRVSLAFTPLRARPNLSCAGFMHLVKGPHSCHCFTGVLEGVSEIRHCRANVSHCHRYGFSPLQNLVISKSLLCTKAGSVC